MRCPKCEREMYPESVYIQVCPYCGRKVDLRKGKKSRRDWNEVKKILIEGEENE